MGEDFLKQSQIDYFKMNKPKKDHIQFIQFVFALYLLALLYLVFVLDRVEHSEYQYNLVLFDEIKRYIKYRNIVGNRLFITNIAGNIVGFIPFGLMLPFMSNKYANLFFVTLLSFEFSLFIELTQLIFRIGSFDVDDLLLNTCGGFIGCMIYYMTRHLRRKRHGHKKKSFFYR